LGDAAAAAAAPDALGGRVLLYGALMRSLAHGDSSGGGGEEWGARGTLLGGSSSHVLHSFCICCAFF
jgi:hypothetical protein